MQKEMNKDALQGVLHASYHPNGILKECMLEDENKIETTLGPLIPKYQRNAPRDKFVESLAFYPSGSLKNIYLNERTSIPTRYGDFFAELLTFYPDGSLHRLFPSNGKLSGFWSAEDEASLIEPLSFTFPFTNFECKISALQFYPSGQLKSITLWEKQYVGIHTQGNIITTRIGFSLFENGNIQSLEPAFPTEVNTPIGMIHAYNIDALGVHAESNSLVYNEQGDVISLINSTDQVKLSVNNETFIFEPESVPSLLDLTKTTIAPIKLTFKKNQLEITDAHSKTHTFSLSDAIFDIKQVKTVGCQDGSDCSSCDLCS